MTTLKEFTEDIVAFRDEGDWEQFHTPGQLAAALSIEAAELQDLYLWRDDTSVLELLDQPDFRKDVQREIADVLIYSLLFCDAIDSDPRIPIKHKLDDNAENYPVDLASGRAKKYTELDSQRSETNNQVD